MDSIPGNGDEKPKYFLEMRDIVVHYGPVVANDHVHLEIEKGEIHALLGENGAGKTTLMKVLVGLVRPQMGEIIITGETVNIRSAMMAMDLGIGMVHQHFMLIPTLTVAQNVCIGLRSAGFPFPNLRQVAEDIRKLANQYNLRIDPQVKVSQLSVGAQQRVEIIKALYRGAEMLILDEPTSVLTPQETEGLFEVVRSLKDQGSSVIFISHKLNEVMNISDRVTVLRQGKVVDTQKTADTNPQKLAYLMVGREVKLPSLNEKTFQESGSLVKIEHLKYTDKRNLTILKDINLDIRRGEIHGIAGVDGNGQEELSRLLAGLLPVTNGKIVLNDQDITHSRPAERIKAGMSYIPADRQHVGLVLDLPLVENCALGLNHQDNFSKWGLINFKETERAAQEMIQTHDVRCRDIYQSAATLSGGNQQKLVLARELYRKPDFIIAAQPTRGLDIGATEYVR